MELELCNETGYEVVGVLRVEESDEFIGEDKFVYPETIMIQTPSGMLVYNREFTDYR